MTFEMTSPMKIKMVNTIIRNTTISYINVKHFMYNFKMIACWTPMQCLMTDDNAYFCLFVCLRFFFFWGGVFFKGGAFLISDVSLFQSKICRFYQFCPNCPVPFSRIFHLIGSSLYPLLPTWSIFLSSKWCKKKNCWLDVNDN